MKYPVFIIFICFVKVYAQEISVTVDSANISIENYYMTIPYKFKNNSDKEITFLDKQDFFVIDRCYYLSKSENQYYEQHDTMRAIDDFITLKPYEETERKVVLYIHWPCRSAPTRHFSFLYSESLTTEDNYYILNNDKHEKVFMYAWTGEIISPLYNIVLYR